MKSMLIAASVTGAIIAALILSMNRKKVGRPGKTPALEGVEDQSPVRNMKFTMG